MKTLSIIFWTVLILLIFNDIAAQINIDGTITDPELNPISDAMIEIIDQDDTSNYYSANTNESGYFSISVITDLNNRNAGIPSDHLFVRNYPNPFNPSTIIYYELPISQNIEIKIYDILGREIKTLYNNFHKAGKYTLQWNGRNNWNSPVAAGVYLCRLKTKDNFIVHKMVLLDGGAPVSNISMTNNKSIPDIKKNSEISFNYSVRISGSDIFESEFNHLSCKSDTTLNFMVPKILHTVSIGPSGGKLETEGFSLTIPEGAFMHEETLSLGLEADSVLFEEELFSKSFRIDGLPELIYQDLRIKIKLDNPPNDSISIAVGETGKAAPFEYEFMDYDYFSAEDSSGYAAATITSPFTNNSGFLKTIDYSSIKNSVYKKKLIVVLSSPNAVLSSDGNFKIYYPNSKALYIPIIDEYLEDAVKVVESLGFTKSPVRSLLIASNWPVKVIFNKCNIEKVYSQSRFGASTWKGGKYKKENNKDFLIKNWKIIINTDNFSQSYPDNLRRTLGRDIFKNFVHQSNLYENDASIYNWLNFSLFTWVAELFPKEDNFIPWLYDFNSAELPKNLQLNLIKEILEGIYFDDKDDDFVKHLLAFSSLVDYLTTTSEQGDKIIYEIYQKIRSENTSEDALLKTMNDTENIWWPNFFREYIQGNVYNVPPEKFVENISESIEFKDGDTLKSIDETYRDLSAKLFRVDIISEEIKNKKLKFELGPQSLNLDYVKALVFGITEYNLAFISEGTDFLIGNLNKYNGLLTCIVNSGNEPPYTGTSNIELDIRISDSELPFEGIMTISARFNEDLHLKTATDEYDITGADYIDHFVTGKVKLINDSTYWGKWDKDDQIGYHHKGSMTVIIDPVTEHLRYFESDEVRDVDWGIVATEKIVSNPLYLPPSNTGTFWWDFIEWGKNAKDALYKLEYKEVAADPGTTWEQTLIKFEADTSSYIRVNFNFDPLN